MDRWGIDAVGHFVVVVRLCARWGHPRWQVGRWRVRARAEIVHQRCSTSIGQRYIDKPTCSWSSRHQSSGSVLRNKAIRKGLKEPQGLRERCPMLDIQFADGAVPSRPRAALRILRHSRDIALFWTTQFPPPSLPPVQYAIPFRVWHLQWLDES